VALILRSGRALLELLYSLVLCSIFTETKTRNSFTWVSTALQNRSSCSHILQPSTLNPTYNLFLLAKALVLNRCFSLHDCSGGT